MLRHTLLALPLLLCTGAAMAQSPSNPAYLVSQFEITDAANFQKFGVASNPLVKAHGGEFLSRRNKVVAAVGDPPKNVTIVRFPSMEKAQEYLQSAKYKALIPNRDASARFHSLLYRAAILLLNDLGSGVKYSPPLLFYRPTAS